MEQLNLPIYQLKVKKTGNVTKIFDDQRRKYVTLTPEEWVRQNFVHYLIKQKGYSPALLANEVTISFNGMSRRCDSVLYGQDMRPVMIMEYKAPSVMITQKVFEQTYRYNIILRAKYIIVSNGLNHYCCKIDYENQTYSFMEDIPDYKDL